MNKETVESLIIKDANVYVKLYRDYTNERLKIEDFRGNIQIVLEHIERIQKESFIKKIIVKSRQEYLYSFIHAGFLMEAVIPGYFLGSDGYFLCKYTDQARFDSERWLEEDSILTGVWKKKQTEYGELEPRLLLRKATEKDADSLAGFYASVFPIYPVPIDDPSYIEAQIKADTIFHLMEENGVIIAAASAEVNKEYKNAEITDCATLTTHRKGGYMNYIVRNLENELITNQIFCAYSIARALSFGMNAVLYNLDYTYTGRLKNNCYIYDKIEDMNVWSKDLSVADAKNPARNAEN